jgi:hypothetical protein
VQLFELLNKGLVILRPGFDIVQLLQHDLTPDGPTNAIAIVASTCDRDRATSVQEEPNDRDKQREDYTGRGPVHRVLGYLQVAPSKLVARLVPLCWLLVLV